MGPFAEPNAAARGRVQVASQVPLLSPSIRITPQARYYAVAELCRRAGIPRDFFRTWKVSVSSEKTVFEISNGATKTISFPHASSQRLSSLAAGRFASASVPLQTPLAGDGTASLSDCVVPFVADENSKATPLFYLADPNRLECAVDLPLAILLTLSCWEEALDSPRDVHGRFQARNSIAFMGKFLDRPVVDEYGLAFEQAMGMLYPSWEKTNRKLRIKVTHDADHVGIPFRWATVIRHAVRAGAVHHSVRDMLSRISGVEPAELRSVRNIATASIQHGLKSTIYWKAAQRGLYDSGYDPRQPKVREVVNWLDEVGMESGVHPGYNTFRAPEKLRREVAILRELLGTRPLGGRQHYLRWNPDMWLDYENCGLAYDSSVAFAEQVGFKAGTCLPYHPWLFALNRPADLMEIPLVVMDRTLLSYMGLNKAQALQTVQTLMDRCQMVGGVFTIVWHNDVFLDPFYRDVYLNLLETFSGIDNYDWKADSGRPLSQ